MLCERWMATVSYFKLLALNGVLEIFLSTVHHLNLTVGMARATSLVIAVRAVITIPIVLWLVPIHGNPTAAAAALARSCLTAPLNVCVVGRAIKFGARAIAGITWRPVMRCLIIFALFAIMIIWTVLHRAVGRASHLVVLASFSVTTYIVFAWVLWRLSKRHGMRRSLDTGKYRWA
jgi:hypothetical protein